MKGFLKGILAVFIPALLMLHILIVFLFLVPVPKLLSLMVGNQYYLVKASEIPENVEQFLTDNNISIEVDYESSGDFFSHFIAAILKFRRDHLTPSEKLALDMNVLDFDHDVIGLSAAADYYYQKPLSELSDQQWINLINLQKIFYKK